VFELPLHVFHDSSSFDETFGHLFKSLLLEGNFLICGLHAPPKDHQKTARTNKKTSDEV